MTKTKHFLTLLAFMILNTTPQYLAYADDDDSSSEVEDVAQEGSPYHPPTRKLSESELTTNNDFSKFQAGPYFLPLHSLYMLFFGYEKPKEFFHDFKDDLETENEDVAVCEGEDNDDADGLVKLTFECDDGEVEYSCYADLESNSYSVDIPSEVVGLSCYITVESVEVTDDETDVESSGTETTEEVELDSDSEITIDVEE